MAYFIPKFHKPLPKFCHVNQVFTPEEVDKIIDLEDLQRFQKGSIGLGDPNPNSDGGAVNTNVRNSDVCWISHEQNSDWLFGKFAHLTSQVNQDHFLYNIEYIESFQYTVYRGEENQHYDWHIDAYQMYSPTERKMSASILLSDPEEYEGGEFEIVLDGRVNEPIAVKPKKGDVLFFASWMPHRVRPVTSGVRKSLVAWIMGKRETI